MPFAAMPFASSPRSLLLGLTLVVGLAVGGCGGSPAPASPTSPAPVATTPSPVSPPSSPSAGGDPRPSATVASPFAVPGTVSARKGRCVYFTPGDMAVSWVLRGSLTAGLRAGDQVTVTGTLDDVADPACGTAKVFRVTKLSRS